MFVLRVAHKRQVRVKNEREITARCHSERSEESLKLLRAPLQCEIPRSARDDRLQGEAKMVEAIETFFDDVDAGRVTQAHGAIVAKGSAGHNRHVRFAQKPVGEVLRSQAELANVYEYIKRALRFHRGYVRNFRDAIEHVVASHIEFFAHIGQGLLIAFESGERAALRE